jgi:hypothetical protein
MKRNSIFIILLVIIAIAGVVGIVLLNTTSTDNNHNNNHSNNNSTNISNNTHNSSHNNSVGEGNIIVTQKGPSSGSYNSNVSIIWTVTNKGSSPITDVKATSQFAIHDFGTIGAGESKSTTLNVFIPDPSYIDGNSSNVIHSDDFYIGGFSIEYKLNGQTHKMSSNSISIAIK